MRYIVFIFALLLVGCLPDGEVHIAYNDQPVDIGDGWRIGVPEDVGMNSAKVREAYKLLFEDDTFRASTGLLVIRHGRLVGEGYLRHLEDRTLREAIQSSTKSWTSLLLGIAQSEGHSLELDATLFELTPRFFEGIEGPEKRSITLRHLLTMRSGIEFDNDDFALEMLSDRPREQMRYILKKPMYAAPGEAFYYRDADPQLVSGVIQEITGESLAQIARRRLMVPMGIEDWSWGSNIDGETHGAYGLYLRARDRAKLGQLVLQRGVWEGAQLIPEAWITLSTSFHTDVDRMDEDTEQYPYGFYWWLIPELNGFTTWGHGGNFTIILPDQDMVIVHTAEPDTNGETAAVSLTELLPVVRLLVNAIEE